MASTTASSSSGSASVERKSTGAKTVLKCVVLGNAGVGKTSLLSRYISPLCSRKYEIMERHWMNRFVDPLFSFNATYKATIGSDLKSKEIVIDEKPVVLQIVCSPYIVWYHQFFSLRCNMAIP
jgi:GTPase SAR1 family protein